MMRFWATQKNKQICDHGFQNVGNYDSKVKINSDYNQQKRKKILGTDI